MNEVDPALLIALRGDFEGIGSGGLGGRYGDARLSFERSIMGINRELRTLLFSSCTDRDSMLSSIGSGDGARSSGENSRRPEIDYKGSGWWL